MIRHTHSLNKILTRIAIISLVIFTSSSFYTSKAQSADRYPVLVTCQWLGDNLSNPDVIVLQVNNIRQEYDNGHIPGARFLWPGWLIVSNENESNVPAGVKDIRKTLESVGINNSSHIILCGTGSNLVVVCRIFVTLEHIGLGGHVSILEGGFNEWKDSDRKVSVESPGVARGNLQTRLVANLVDLDWMKSHLTSKDYQIIDARPERSYEGVAGSDRSGHIPGAENLPATTLYDSKTLHFIPEAKIREALNNVGLHDGLTPVFYCGTGYLACIDYVAATIAGYKPVIYDGSMENWGSHLELPLEKSTGN